MFAWQLLIVILRNILEISLQTFTFSKSAMETLEKGAKYVQN